MEMKVSDDLVLEVWQGECPYCLLRSLRREERGQGVIILLEELPKLIEALTKVMDDERPDDDQHG